MCAVSLKLDGYCCVRYRANNLVDFALAEHKAIHSSWPDQLASQGLTRLWFLNVYVYVENRNPLSIRETTCSHQPSSTALSATTSSRHRLCESVDPPGKRRHLMSIFCVAAHFGAAGGGQVPPCSVGKMMIGAVEKDRLGIWAPYLKRVKASNCQSSNLEELHMSKKHPETRHFWCSMILTHTHLL